MISIRIYGCKDIAFRSKIRSCVEFCISELIPNKKRLLIKIFLLKNLLKTDNVYGVCYPLDLKTNNCHHLFHIDLDLNMKKEDIIKTIIHEMTHVKQFATGELLYDRRDFKISIWKGVRYLDDLIPYAKMPWEIEASINETKLLEKWQH